MFSRFACVTLRITILFTLVGSWPGNCTDNNAGLVILARANGFRSQEINPATACADAAKRGACTNPGFGVRVTSFCCLACGGGAKQAANPQKVQNANKADFEEIQKRLEKQLADGICKDDDEVVKEISRGKIGSCKDAASVGGCTNPEFGKKVQVVCCTSCKAFCGDCQEKQDAAADSCVDSTKPDRDIKDCARAVKNGGCTNLLFGTVVKGDCCASCAAANRIRIRRRLGIGADTNAVDELNSNAKYWATQTEVMLPKSHANGIGIDWSVFEVADTQGRRLSEEDDDDTNVLNEKLKSLLTQTILQDATADDDENDIQANDIDLTGSGTS